MNSNTRSSNSHAGDVFFSNYQFDFGLPSNSRSSGSSLNEQKNQRSSSHSSHNPSTTLPQPSSYPISFSGSVVNSSWTHQISSNNAPRSGMTTQSSMAGDILGKNWTSSSSHSSSSSSSSSFRSTSVHISQSNPNLFRDLLGAAFGSSNQDNISLKNANRQNNSSPIGNSSSIKINNCRPLSSSKLSPNNNQSNATGSSLRDPGSKVESTFNNIRKDPFVSLGDLGLKNSPPGNKIKNSQNSFGASENISIPERNPSTAWLHQSSLGNENVYFPTSYSTGNNPSDAFPVHQPFYGSHSKVEGSLENLLSSASTASTFAEQNVENSSHETSDWGFESQLTADKLNQATEHQSFTGPPAGITASTAKERGLDSFKQGQFVDAIKWLTWSSMLSVNSANTATIAEILSCRSSCYKEIGEYKKAIMDCTKILEGDATNVSVLLQRALLYESSEKYKLGAEDLRMVLKLDPGNSLAKGMIHRLIKLAN